MLPEKFEFINFESKPYHAEVDRELLLHGDLQVHVERESQSGGANDLYSVFQQRDPDSHLVNLSGGHTQLSLQTDAASVGGSLSADLKK